LFLVFDLINDNELSLQGIFTSVDTGGIQIYNEKGIEGFNIYNIDLTTNQKSLIDRIDLIKRISLIAPKPKFKYNGDDWLHKRLKVQI
jgi:hypothetical protein